MKHYYPKSQTLRFGAVFIWGLCLLAIGQNMGLYLESGGVALAALLGLAVMGYLKSGKRVDVNLADDEVRSVWRLFGIPLRVSRQEIVAEAIELRPEWMRWLRVQGGSVKGVQKALVYDLVLVGHEDYIEEPPRDVVIDLTMDQMLFTLAERRARGGRRTEPAGGGALGPALRRRSVRDARTRPVASPACVPATDEGLAQVGVLVIRAGLNRESE